MQRHIKIKIDYDRETYDVHVESNECEYSWEEIGCITTIFTKYMISQYDDVEFETYMDGLYNALKAIREQGKITGG